MSTVIRPEISGKKPYWLSKHRFYELKHFCLQYPAWKEFYSRLDGFPTRSYGKDEVRRPGPGDPVAEIVERKLYFKDRMEMVERAAKDTDAVIGEYIFIGVTRGLSYEKLRARYDIPCCKGTYYDLFRKFFWLLDKRRG